MSLSAGLYCHWWHWMQALIWSVMKLHSRAIGYWVIVECLFVSIVTVKLDEWSRSMWKFLCTSWHICPLRLKFGWKESCRVGPFRISLQELINIGLWLAHLFSRERGAKQFLRWNLHRRRQIIFSCFSCAFETHIVNLVSSTSSKSIVVKGL